MAIKRQHLESWVAEHCPGERLVTYVVTSTRSAGTVGSGAQSKQVSVDGDAQRRELQASLGLEQEHRVQLFQSDTFVVITDRQYVIVSRSGFRSRPKKLLHAVPLDRIRLWWFDFDRGPNHFRHFVTDFGDGSWRSDRTGLKALGRELTTSNAHEYVQVLADELGDRVQALDFDDL